MIFNLIYLFILKSRIEILMGLDKSGHYSRIEFQIRAWTNFLLTYMRTELNCEWGLAWPHQVTLWVSELVVFVALKSYNILSWIIESNSWFSWEDASLFLIFFLNTSPEIFQSISSLRWKSQHKILSQQSQVALHCLFNNIYSCMHVFYKTVIMEIVFKD